MDVILKGINMLLAGFDLETTGFDGSKDHIVQYSFQIWNDSERLLNETSFVNPEVHIPNSEIHGITDEMVVDSPNELVSLRTISDLFIKCYEHSIPIVIMNAQFDISFIESLINNYQHLNLDVELQYNIIDLFVIDKHFDKWRSGSRTLESLAATYGVETSDDFHSAEYDVEVSIQVARRMISKYDLYGDWNWLHKIQSRWHYEQQKSLYDYFCSQNNEAFKTVKAGWPVATHLMMME